MIAAVHSLLLAATRIRAFIVASICVGSIGSIGSVASIGSIATISSIASVIAVAPAAAQAQTATPAATSTATPAAPRRATTGPRRVSLIITGGIVVTVDADRRVLNPGAIAIDGADIVAVDTPGAIARQFTAAQTITAAGQIVMPGLINTHTHAPMVMYRGLADDLALMDWLQKYIFPAEAKTVTPAFVRTGTRLAALEMIQSGTTAYADMYYFEEEVAKATKEAGMRGVLGQTVIKFPVADAKTPADALARARTFIQQWKNDPLIVPAVAPHSPYTLDGETLKAASALARELQVPMLIHLGETRDEVEIIRTQYQHSPTAYLDALGILGPNVLAAHGVWVSNEDIAMLKARGVGISHNPESNMKLASGTAPVVKYLNAGVPVGLGTDGAASNNDLDMFEAMRFAALLHKLQNNDPKATPAPVVLEMATRMGARILGLEKQIGSLEAGKHADLITLALDRARQTPMYDPVSHIVYVAHGDDVRSVMVNGKFLMRDRKMLTLDEAHVLSDARAAAAQVRAAVTATPAAATPASSAKPD
jgi:5-methylthioadenosine/S-adenosylhomocysteine deaminase